MKLSLECAGFARDPAKVEGWGHDATVLPPRLPLRGDQSLAETDQLQETPQSSARTPSQLPIPAQATEQATETPESVPTSSSFGPMKRNDS